MKIFSTRNMQLLKKSLDVYTKQHEAISKNVANANDPDYKRVDADFSKSLKAANERTLKVTNKRHIIDPKTPDRIFSKDGIGKVDISKEMGELAENQIRFDFASRALNRMYRSLNLSITGRN